LPYQKISIRRAPQVFFSPGVPLFRFFRDFTRRRPVCLFFLCPKRLKLKIRFG
jgi:hypothetical protein